uniref:Uncharacterized protein n=1 Tax=Tanacetum cinerariifolium TaxID=118510 RepID=A0A699GJN1_TANCI|nr:hypothetical protein [Tanacetum cinerariifolium]
MSSITVQQAKLDLKLVPKEKRLEIGKCNERLNPGKIQREPIFQVVLNALALTSCYSAFLSLELGHTGEINSLNDVVVDHMHQLWRTFAALNNKKFIWKDNWDDYLINTLRFVFAKEESQIYGAILPECLTSPEMKETQAYQTCIGFATRATPPKIARKFKKPASPKLTTVLVLTETPTRKSKRVKRPAKKSTKTPARGVVIRETPEIPLTKKRKRKKSMRDFHKTHPSGSGTVTKTTLIVAKIKPFATSEGTGVKPGVLDVAEEESSKSEAESWGNDKDDSNNEQVSSDEDNDQEKDNDDDKTQSENELDQPYDDVDIRLNEPVDTDEGFVQEEDIPHTCFEIVSLLDVHVHHEVLSQQTPTHLTVPVSVISESLLVFSIVILQSLPSFTPSPQQSSPTTPPTTKATNPQSVLPNFTSVFRFNNRVTTLEKEVVVLKKDDPLKTQVTALIDEHLDARLGTTKDEFINSLSASITAVLAKVSSQPQSSYEAAATLTEFELKKIFIDKIDKSESYLAALEHRYCYEGLKKSYDLDKIFFSTYGKRKTRKDAKPAKGPKAKESQSSSSKGDNSKSKSFRKSVLLEEPEFDVADFDMPHNQEENPDNDDEPKEKTPEQGQNQSWLMTLTSFVEKPSKTFDEFIRTLIDFSAFIMNDLNINNLTQETLLGPAFRLLKGTRSNYAELEYDFDKCYKALSEKHNWENPKDGDYPFDLTKPLPLVKIRNSQKVPVDYFFNNDLKYLQGGISTIPYMTSLTKTKAAQYDFPGIEDMVPNIWSPVKATYDKHALWGISHLREQHKTFYAYARGLQSKHDVYSTKRILAVTQIEVMRKHGYGYLQEIIVRRADNDLYKFKECEFLRLRINDIEDMLLLVVWNWLTNLSGEH